MARDIEHSGNVVFSSWLHTATRQSSPECRRGKPRVRTNSSGHRCCFHSETLSTMRSRATCYQPDDATGSAQPSFRLAFCGARSHGRRRREARAGSRQHPGGPAGASARPGPCGRRSHAAWSLSCVAVYGAASPARSRARDRHAGRRAGLTPVVPSRAQSRRRPVGRLGGAVTRLAVSPGRAGLARCGRDFGACGDNRAVRTRAVVRRWVSHPARVGRSEHGGGALTRAVEAPRRGRPRCPARAPFGTMRAPTRTPTAGRCGRPRRFEPARSGSPRRNRVRRSTHRPFDRLAGPTPTRRRSPQRRSSGTKGRFSGPT